ncbi:membrane protein insertion efficiency factor YidD [Caminibacter pacificus]
MILKKLSIKSVEFYRYFISPLFGQKCRYYPTCSEYALWEYKNDNFFSATVKTILRILRCNQLFRGGIDYPVITKRIKPVYGKKEKIDFWYIPAKKKNKYIVIKANNE